ncbi:CTD nuclear envelope phosphatase 1 [Eretmochelys imbricata]
MTIHACSKTLPFTLLSRGPMGVTSWQSPPIPPGGGGGLRPALISSPSLPPHAQVSQWYELVVFTASMEIYGSAVADKLDNNRSILKRRYYRQHCTLELGSYIKDLAVVHSDLSSVVILDNSPGAYRSHPDNAIPIKSWFSDPSDTALLNLLPMLDALRFTADVRSVLSRNLHQHRLW